jgi:hypothetical protein
MVNAGLKYEKEVTLQNLSQNRTKEKTLPNRKGLSIS